MNLGSGSAVPPRFWRAGAAAGAQGEPAGTADHPTATATATAHTFAPMALPQPFQLHNLQQQQQHQHQHQHQQQQQQQPYHFQPQQPHPQPHSVFLPAPIGTGRPAVSVAAAAPNVAQFPVPAPGTTDVGRAELMALMNGMAHAQAAAVAPLHQQQQQPLQQASRAPPPPVRVVPSVYQAIIEAERAKIVEALGHKYRAHLGQLQAQLERQGLSVGPQDLATLQRSFDDEVKQLEHSLRVLSSELQTARPVLVAGQQPQQQQQQQQQHLQHLQGHQASPAREFVVPSPLHALVPPALATGAPAFGAACPTPGTTASDSVAGGRMDVDEDMAAASAPAAFAQHAPATPSLYQAGSLPATPFQQQAPRAHSVQTPGASPGGVSLPQPLRPVPAPFAVAAAATAGGVGLATVPEARVPFAGAAPARPTAAAAAAAAAAATAAATAPPLQRPVPRAPQRVPPRAALSSRTSVSAAGASAAPATGVAPAPAAALPPPGTRKRASRLVGGPAPMEVVHPRGRKASSTCTISVTGTLLEPNVSETIFALCTVLQLQMMHDVNAPDSVIDKYWFFEEAEMSWHRNGCPPVGGAKDAKSPAAASSGTASSSSAAAGASAAAGTAAPAASAGPPGRAPGSAPNMGEESRAPPRRPMHGARRRSRREFEEHSSWQQYHESMAERKRERERLKAEHMAARRRHGKRHDGGADEEWDEDWGPLPGQERREEPEPPVRQPSRKRRRFELPQLSYMHRFVCALFECARLEIHCAIVALVLINRLLVKKAVPLHKGNWRPILTGAVLIGQKVHADRCLKNRHFVKVCPIFTAAELTRVEKHFLRLIDYNVGISASVYVRYYFELRAICEAEYRRANIRPPPQTERQMRDEKAGKLVQRLPGSIRRRRSELDLQLASTSIHASPSFSTPM